MQQVIQISLSGYPAMLRMDVDAFDALRHYLESARERLRDDPYSDEVMADLEQSIAEKLATLLHTDEQVLDLAEMKKVLAEVGPVDTGGSVPSTAQLPSRGRRQLYRIEEGQDIFGVCQGVAAYSNISADWVKTIFFFLALLTGGAFALVYIAMGFILPVARTREEYFAIQKGLVNSA